MELYYKNSQGEKIDFAKPPYLARDISELLDFDWEYQANNGKVSRFKKQLSEIQITVNVLGDTKKQYDQACDQLFEVMESDVIKNKKGRLYYGSQYFLCNLVGSKKKDHFMDVDYHLNYLRFVSDYPFWILEEQFRFLKQTNGYEIQEYLDYPLDYPHDYTGDVKGTGAFHIDTISSCHFLLTIYGKVEDPRILIDGHPYEVFTAVAEKEYLTIDSREKTVTRIRQNGLVVNEFNSRRKEPSIFEKISPGHHVINWDGNFGFDILIFKERSEPKCR